MRNHLIPHDQVDELFSSIKRFRTHIFTSHLLDPVINQKPSKHKWRCQHFNQKQVQHLKSYSVSCVFWMRNHSVEYGESNMPIDLHDDVMNKGLESVLCLSLCVRRYDVFSIIKEHVLTTTKYSVSHLSHNNALCRLHKWCLNLELRQSTRGSYRKVSCSAAPQMWLQKGTRVQ